MYNILERAVTIPPTPLPPHSKTKKKKRGGGAGGGGGAAHENVEIMSGTQEVEHTIFNS